MPTPDLRGKLAVVTGSSRGAGHGIALALGDAGATVYVAARTARGGRVPSDGAPGDEEHWRAVPLPEDSETPEYVERAVAALAADARVIDKSGQRFASGDLAAEYGFTDADGRRVPRPPAV